MLSPPSPNIMKHSLFPFFNFQYRPKEQFVVHFLLKKIKNIWPMNMAYLTDLKCALASAVSAILFVKSPLIFNTKSIYLSNAPHLIFVSAAARCTLSTCNWEALREVLRWSDFDFCVWVVDSVVAVRVEHRVVVDANSPILYMCVCVCVWERERERESAWESVRVCVWERERERERDRVTGSERGREIHREKETEGHYFVWYQTFTIYSHPKITLKCQYIAFYCVCYCSYISSFSF